MTNTRTHVHVEWANPFLTCDQCKKRAGGYHDPVRCGCEAGHWLVPCEHNAAATSVCPSWSPVDGCCCLAHLGYVPHSAVFVQPSTDPPKPPFGSAPTETDECAECGETREHHGPIPFVPKPVDDYSNPEEWEGCSGCSEPERCGVHRGEPCPPQSAGPVWVEPVLAATKPPYGSPERAAYDAASRTLDEAESLADFHRAEAGDDVIQHRAQDYGWGLICEDCDWIVHYVPNGDDDDDCDSPTGVYLGGPNERTQQ